MKMHWEKGKTILGLMRQVGKRRLILVIKKAELKRLKPGLCTGEYEGQKKMISRSLELRRVRIWKIKSIDIFLDLLNMRSLGIFQVKTTRK